MKTIHVRFQLLNCFFSDKLADVADRSEYVDRAALDSGAVADNSVYWKLVEDHFSNGVLVHSVDGNLWAEKLPFEHPFIANYHEKVCPETHGMFLSTDLRMTWKRLRKEYDKVL
jgi:hypothetical protein